MTTEERCAEIETQFRTLFHSFDHARDLPWAIAQIRALTEELKTAESVAWDLQEANDRLREEREEDRRVFGNLLDAIEAEQAVGGVSAVTYSRALLNTLRARLATTEPKGTIEDAGPPLTAAGRFSTIAKPGVLPPIEWDEEQGG